MHVYFCIYNAYLFAASASEIHLTIVYTLFTLLYIDMGGYGFSKMFFVCTGVGPVRAHFGVKFQVRVKKDFVHFLTVSTSVDLNSLCEKFELI